MFYNKRDEELGNFSEAYFSPKVERESLTDLIKTETQLKIFWGTKLNPIVNKNPEMKPFDQDQAIIAIMRQIR